MGILFLILFPAFLVAIGVAGEKYYRMLQSIIDYSQNNSVNVFGTQYRSLFQMASDITFSSNLWDSNKVESCEDEGLKVLLLKANKMFKWQMYGGLSLFLAFFIFQVIQAS